MDHGRLPKSHRDWRNILKNVATWALVGIGVVGVTIGVLDLFVQLDQLLPFLKRPQDILLIMIAFLAVGLGIERLAIIGELETEIRRTHSDMVEAFNVVQQALVAAVPFRVLTSEKAIFEEANRIINACKDADVIRATGLTPGASTHQEDSAFQLRYLQTVAKRVKKARERGGSLSYRVVLGSGSDRQQSIQMRRDVFSTEGVLDRMVIKSVDMTWPLELLLVGDSLIIGFVSLTGDLTFRVGVRVTNKDLIRHVSEWYDDFLWNVAKFETPEASAA